MCETLTSMLITLVAMALPWCYNAVPMVTAVQEDAGRMSELFHYGIRTTSTLICY